MTVRLSAMFEEHMRRILSIWKSACKRNEYNDNVKTKKTKGKRKQKRKHKLSNGTSKRFVCLIIL